MEEIKINKAWYEGLLTKVTQLENVASKFGHQYELTSTVAFLSGYVRSLDSQFKEDEQLRKS